MTPAKGSFNPKGVSIYRLRTAILEKGMQLRVNLMSTNSEQLELQEVHIGVLEEETATRKIN